MTIFQTAIAILATISLFLHGLHGFSREIRELGADRLKQWLTSITSYRIGGFLLGAVFTALIQSSSAVSSISVALVDAGAVSFYGSLSVLLGANVGTTATAWLVSLKIAGLGPFFIVLGSLVGFLPLKLHLLGRTLFYFGFILFSLDLISQALLPLQQMPEVKEWLKEIDHPYTAILAGAVLTALLQSSSVVSGMAIIIAGQGLFSPEMAVGVIIGANVGTTSTALLASMSMSGAAKRAAQVNFVFNFVGLIAFAPFVRPFAAFCQSLNSDIGQQVALAHLLFNVIVGVFFLAILPLLRRYVTLFQDLPANAAN